MAQKRAASRPLIGNKIFNTTWPAFAFLFCFQKGKQQKRGRGKIQKNLSRIFVTRFFSFPPWCFLLSRSTPRNAIILPHTVKGLIASKACGFLVKAPQLSEQRDRLPIGSVRFFFQRCGNLKSVSLKLRFSPGASWCDRPKGRSDYKKKDLVMTWNLAVLHPTQIRGVWGGV